MFLWCQSRAILRLEAVGSWNHSQKNYYNIMRSHTLLKYGKLEQQFFFSFLLKRRIGYTSHFQIPFHEHQSLIQVSVHWSALKSPGVYLSHFDNSVSFDSNETQSRYTRRPEERISNSSLNVHLYKCMPSQQLIRLGNWFSAYLRREPRTLETHCK